MHEQIEVADIAERTLETYNELTFANLVEKSAEHSRAQPIIYNWGYDRFKDMLCYALGFKRDEKTQKYIPGSKDKNLMLHFLHFLQWRYEEGKLYYQPSYGRDGN